MVKMTITERLPRHVTTEAVITPSPSKSRDDFVTSLQCDASRVNVVACLKVFPLTPTSQYERLYCMSSVLIRQKTNNKHSCNCETCKPDVHCCMSCQALAAFGEAPDANCSCTPITGGDGKGPIPNWCGSPQGQTEFFTECHSPSLKYTCELYQRFFENGFSITREHYAVWKTFSCKGQTVEKTLITCLSKALVKIVNNRSIMCNIPRREITLCLKSFRDQIGTSSNPLCQDSVRSWDQMLPGSAIESSNAEFENIYSPVRGKVNKCLTA